ncbi:MAG: beta-glucosidase [Aureispira sp.]
MLKFLLGLLLILTLVVTIIYFKSIHYTTHALDPDPERFTAIQTEEDIDSLVDQLVSSMTLKEKIDQMCGEKSWRSAPKFLINFFVRNRFPHVYVGKNKRLGIPPWVLSDGPRGARVMDKAVNGVTTFPVAMARGASWDIHLERKVNEVIAIEMRANKTNYAATPCINVLRHPGWGRAQETYGEDPWHLGQFGVAAVQGIQHHNVMACPKHFALNSIENSRWVVNVEVDDRTLREVYLPHFKKVVQEGKAASLMSAYNYVRGEQCGANKELLTDILREEWGFEGFVSSDWIYGLYDGIGGIKAGLDVEMPWQQQYKYKTIKKGIKSGEITLQQIDAMVTRILRTRLRFAFAKDKMDYDQGLIANEQHIQLAREVAEKSMVLLKNNNVLPFQSAKNKKIAVIGRLADLENTGDHGSSNSTPPYVITPYQGIKAFHEKLGNEVIFNDGSNLEEAKKIASTADEVILVVGYTYEDEGEYIILSRKKMMKSAKAKKLIGKKGMGGDRCSLQLLATDELLINTLAPLNANTVVTYVGGSAIDMSNWEEKVPAILFAWYSGMEGGHALANILYGNANPSGKLPFTIAANEKDYPAFNPYIDHIQYGYYHGYTLFEKEKKPVAYPFGYGLSYTSFEYSGLALAHSNLQLNDTLKVAVTIKNTGEIAGAEVAQLYIGFQNSQIDRPLKLLRGFDKIYLKPKEEKTIIFKLPIKDIAYYNTSSKDWEVEEMEYKIFVGGSSNTKELLVDKFFVIK